MPSETPKKKPRYPAIKFRLMPREENEDGTLEDIETWIKRESARLLQRDWRSEEFLEEIDKADAERSAAGELYGSMHSQYLKDAAKLRREANAAVKKIRAQQKKDYDSLRKPYLAAKKDHTQKVRALKTLKAKYNTYCNRYFTAVSQKVFQNMKSICGIQHTWGDKKVKRDIRTAGVNKGTLPKKSLDDALNNNPVANGEFSE